MLTSTENGGVNEDSTLSKDPFESHWCVLLSRTTIFNGYSGGFWAVLASNASMEENAGCSLVPFDKPVESDWIMEAGFLSVIRKPLNKWVEEGEVATSKNAPEASRLKSSEKRKR